MRRGPMNSGQTLEVFHVENLPLRRLRERERGADDPSRNPLDAARVFPFERAETLAKDRSSWTPLRSVPCSSCEHSHGQDIRSFRLGALSLVFGVLTDFRVFLPYDWRFAHTGRAIVATIPRLIRHEPPVSRLFFPCALMPARIKTRSLAPRGFCARERAGGEGERSERVGVRDCFERRATRGCRSPRTLVSRGARLVKGSRANGTYRAGMWF